jgi:hypothetical protein
MTHSYTLTVAAPGPKSLSAIGAGASTNTSPSTATVWPAVDRVVSLSEVLVMRGLRSQPLPVGGQPNPDHSQRAAEQCLAKSDRSGNLLGDVGIQSG